MKWRKCLILICIMLLVANNSIYADAATNVEDVQPFYTNILSVTADVGNENGKLALQTKINTRYKSELSITAKLQKKSGTSWTTIKTWNSSKTSAISLTISESYVASKGTYRLTATASATRETNTETKTVYSQTITY